MSSPAPIRLAGVVREVLAGPPATWRLTHARDTRVHHDRGELLVEAGGRRVRVEVPAIEVLGPAHEERGGWREVVARAAPRFRADEAQPFDAATLSVIAIAIGDPVAVWGEPIDTGAGGEPLVRARAIARGHHAEAALARRIATTPEGQAARDVRSDRIFRAFVWLCVLAATAGAIAWPLAVRAPHHAALGVSLALLAAALLMRPSGDDDELALYASERDVASGVPTTPLQLLAFAAAIAAPILAPTTRPWSAEIVAGALCAFGLAMRVLSGGALRRMRALVAVRPWRGESGGRATLRGTIRVAAPVRVGPHDAAFGLESKVDERIDLQVNPDVSGADFRERATFLAAPAFTIATAAGDVAVAPRELVWSSTCREIADRVVEMNSSTYTSRRWVPDGAAVAAVGWIEGSPPRLIARGTSPAVLIATAPGDDPLAIPRGLVAYWRGTTLGLLAVGAATAALAVARARGML